MSVYKSVEEIIGKTPIIRLDRIEKEFGLKAKVYAKVESKNPAGSIKDRAALFMINNAEKSGKLKKGGTIIEPTSGNTGIAIAMISAVRGYKAIIVMPNTMSKERIALITAYGAQVELTDGKLGMAGAVERARKICQQRENSIILSQFNNSSNPQAHYQTTAREIEEDLQGKFSYFVAGIGTGGTLCGSAKYFKEKGLNVKVIGVEPDSSPLISKGMAGAHKIQGIGANFIPENFDESLVDEVVTVSDEKAYYYTKVLAQKEGLLVGVSSGAALSATIEIAMKEQNAGKNIVVIFPDSGERYLSNGIFD